MRQHTAVIAAFLLGGVSVLGLLALASVLGPGVSQADDATMHNCPQPGRWAIAVWGGDDGADPGEAFATCGEGAVLVAYDLDPQTGGWLGWFAGRPGMSTLSKLDDMQGVLALGSATGPVVTPTLTPTLTPPPTPTPIPTPAGPATTFGDGVHVVGTDIAPGTYRNSSSSGGCYWERLSGFGGTFDEIIANEFAEHQQLVTIEETDVGFSSEDCGTWTQDLSPITSSPTAPFGDGMYIVGVDIAPGTWRNDGSSGCYWARLSGFSHEFADIIANEYSDDQQMVTISSGDVGFESDDCGMWSKT